MVIFIAATTKISSIFVYALQIVVDAEIISLDAFNRSETVGVVAVAFMKVTIT